jgi:hypothetical protein
VGQVYVLAFTAALNPTLLAAVTFMLSRPGAGRLMLGYLIGAMFTSLTCGLLIVFALDGSSSATSTAKRTVNPVLDIVVGTLVLVIAYIYASGRLEPAMARRAAKKAQKPDKGPPRWQRELDRGSARIGLLVGLVLTLPGASYLAALDIIGKENLSSVAVVLTLVLFNLIMLALLEIPLLGFAFAPEKTNALVVRFGDWLRRRGGRIALIVALVVGVALIARGVISAFT